MKKNNLVYIYIIIALMFLLVVPFTRHIIDMGLNFLSKPLLTVFSSSAQGFRSIVTGWTEISEIRDENRELSEKIKTLQIDKLELEELRHENDVLKSQLGFLEQHKENELVPARIIAREPFGVLDKIIIDKGLNDGVTEKAAVVSDGALVGRVVEVFDHQAKVTLITSKDSIIQAMLQESRTLGIIKGSLAGLRLENIPQDTQVSEGETVITSGLGGEMSQGILIGKVKGEASSKSEIYKILNIELACDLNKLEYVFVVK